MVGSNLRNFLVQGHSVRRCVDLAAFLLEKSLGPQVQRLVRKFEPFLRLKVAISLFFARTLDLLALPLLQLLFSLLAPGLYYLSMVVESIGMFLYTARS